MTGHPVASLGSQHWRMGRLCSIYSEGHIHAQAPSHLTHAHTHTHAHALMHRHRHSCTQTQDSSREWGQFQTRKKKKAGEQSQGNVYTKLCMGEGEAKGTGHPGKVLTKEWSGQPHLTYSGLARLMSMWYPGRRKQAIVWK